MQSRPAVSRGGWRQKATAKGHQVSTKAKAVGKPHKPHKPVRITVTPGGPAGAAGGSSKHHGAKRKHHPAQTHKKHQPAAKHHPNVKKMRTGYSGTDVECCAAEAVTTLLGLGWDDTLRLHDLGDQTIPGAITAAGYQPAEWPGGTLPAGASLILGVWLPAPHAVAVKPDGTWWSWGELFDPADWPEFEVEEAWAVCL